MTKTRIKIHKEPCLCMGLNDIHLRSPLTLVIDSFSYSVSIANYRDRLMDLFRFVGNLEREKRGLTSVLDEREE